MRKKKFFVRTHLLLLLHNITNVCMCVCCAIAAAHRVNSLRETTRCDCDACYNEFNFQPILFALNFTVSISIKYNFRKLFGSRETRDTACIQHPVHTVYTNVHVILLYIVKDEGELCAKIGEIVNSDWSRNQFQTHQIKIIVTQIHIMCERCCSAQRLIVVANTQEFIAYYILFTPSSLALYTSLSSF